jgi:hypothetical protein
MTKYRLNVTWPTLMALLASCAPAASAGSVPLDDYVSALSSAFCERAFACCTTSERSGFFSTSGFETMEECQTAFEAQFASTSSAIREAQAAGRRQYDAAQAGVCVDAIRTLSCGVFSAISTSGTARGLLSECDDVATPLVAVGGACAADDDCIDSFCPATRCVAFSASGAACSATDRCADSQFCNQDGVCETRRPDGAECYSGGDCASGGCVDGVCGLYRGRCDGP